jgi:CRP-like cAMP-binding protein
MNTNNIPNSLNNSSNSGITPLLTRKPSEKQMQSPTLLIPTGPQALSRRSSFSGTDSDGAAMDLTQVLYSLPFFLGAANTDAFIHEVATEMKIRHYKSGDVVIRYGDIAKCMFLIIRGDLAVMSEDNEVEYAVLSSGSFGI